jgi:manganese efflux pump family protein
VKLATRTLAIAGGLLAAVVAAGCGAHTPPGAAAGAAVGSLGRGTLEGCSDYGVYAIEHHITVTRTPAACQGLSRAEVSQAAAVAILRVAGGGDKAIWRKRAAEVAPFVDHLITAPAPAASLPAAAVWPGASAPATSRSGRRDLAMDTAALAAWLVTAGSGAYVLGSWISGGGSLRRRAGPAGSTSAADDGTGTGTGTGDASTGSPPSVVIGHFGLALTGLVLWAIYLAVGWAALAWTAVCMLLPVAGLGMAALTVGLPGHVSAAPAGNDAATGSGGGTAVLSVRAPSVRAPSVRAQSVRAPLVVAGHGVLAVTTMLLVLLAALGKAAG